MTLLPTEALILSLLGNEELTGYAISAKSGGQVEDSVVYPFLKRLENKGLVESRWKEIVINGNRMPLKVYRAVSSRPSIDMVMA